MDKKIVHWAPIFKTRSIKQNALLKSLVIKKKNFFFWKLNPLIGSSRFQIHLCILTYAIVVREFPREAVMKLQPAQFPWI